MSAVPILFLQLIAILGVARLLSAVLRHVHQPPVIGEMLAGIVLGPLVFGCLSPHWQAALFPVDSLAALEGLSELGLVLFMFVVGAELRLPGGARRHLGASGAIGLACVLLPCALGLAIAPFLHSRFAPQGVAFWPFALFMAASLSITAFPVMARILKERGMTESAEGRLALTSAAFDNVFAGFVIALALISSRTDWERFAFTLGGSLVLVGFAIWILRPALARGFERYADDGRPTPAMLCLLLILVFAAAAATRALGLHEVFGAFLIGAILPRDNRLLACLVERIEHLAVIVLMPVFFALAGLHMSADAFSGTGWLALGLVLVAAMAGKVVGGALGARHAGLAWPQALSVGALMNARGLMELIIMKIGLDLGVIDGAIFTMLMIMAVATTLMTTPLLALFGRLGRTTQPHAQAVRNPRSLP
ncbi:MAG TPA: cation:proton antiporter [Dokdonella sp.]|nr:cation:proton antiporter [Dokdonella sp.]